MLRVPADQDVASPGPAYQVEPYLSAACALLAIDVGAVAEGAGIDRASLDDPEFLVDLDRFAAIRKSLAFEYGRADLPLRVATGFARSAFGLPFVMFQCSATVGDGVANIARYKSALTPKLWRVDRDGGGLQLRIDEISPVLPVCGSTELMEFV